jgi:acyl-coenzyme A thioesterase 9
MAPKADTFQVRRETNTFYFTMAKEDGKPFGKVVVPETYTDAMLFLEGERRLAVGREMRQLYRTGDVQGDFTVSDFTNTTR